MIWFGKNNHDTKYYFARRNNSVQLFLNFYISSTLFLLSTRHGLFWIYFQLNKISRSTLVTSNSIVRVFQNRNGWYSLASFPTLSFPVPCIVASPRSWLPKFIILRHILPFRPHASSYWHWIWRRNDTIYRGRWTCKPWFTAPMKRDGLENRVRFSVPPVLVNRLNCFENVRRVTRIRRGNRGRGDRPEEGVFVRIERSQQFFKFSVPFDSSGDKPEGAKSVWYHKKRDFIHYSNRGNLAYNIRLI